MDTEIRIELVEKPIEWYGDLDDDCSAIWAGFLLRAEDMDGKVWWWAVTDLENESIEIDSSNNYETPCIGGREARLKAEQVSKEYVKAIVKK